MVAQNFNNYRNIFISAFSCEATAMPQARPVHCEGIVGQIWQEISIS